MIFNPLVLLEKENGSITQDLSSKLFEERIIFLFHEITDDLAASIIAQMIFLDSISQEDITLYINSPGGSVSAGLAIYDTMNFIKSDVRTICIGMAASMASVLLAGGTKGKRAALCNSDVLIHQPLSGVSGQATDILIVSNRIQNIRKRVNKILAKSTGKREKTIEQDTERDYYLSSKEALEYGIIDEVIAEK